MSHKKKFVVVGAGAMGQITIRDLVEFAPQDSEIVVGDYHLEAAKDYVDQLKDQRLRAIKVDVRDIEGTAKKLKGAVVVINCVQYQLNLDLMQAALLAKTNYIDLGGLFHYTRKQMKFDKAFKKIDRIALIGMGAAPGITNILARYCADQLQEVNEIHARLATRDLTKYLFKPVLPVSYSLHTILEEFSFRPAVYTKGKFKFIEPMSGAVEHPFPKPVGVQKPMYTIHSEVATLPLSFRKQGVKEVSFKIAFDPMFVDRVKFLRDFGLAAEQPLEMNGSKVIPIELVNRIAKMQPQAKIKGTIKQHEVVRTIVKGKLGQKKVTMVADCHTRGIAEWGFGTDVNTGCPPAIAALMLSDHKISGSGVVPPEVAIDPKAFFKELKKRHMWVKQQTIQDWSFPV